MRRNNRLLIFSIAFIAVLLLVSVFGVWAVTDSAWQRAESNGQQMAENYRLKNEALFAEYRITLEQAAHTLKGMRENGASLEEVHQWMRDYTRDVLGARGLHTGIYGCFDGVFFTGEDWEPDAAYNPAAQQWYVEAARNHGQIYYSDVYVTAMEQEKAVSLSVQINETDVIGINILLWEIENVLQKDLIADGSLQVIYDRIGAPIGHKCWLPQEECFHTAEYLHELYEQVEAHPFEESFRYRCSAGERHSVYSSWSETGWLNVSSVQTNVLTASYTRFAILLWGALVLYLLILVFFILRSYRNARSAQDNERALLAMGNTYYAIFLVSLDGKDCRFIKTLPDIQAEMGEDRHYQRLLEVIAGHIKAESAEEFRRIFSLENIRQKLQENVTEFGGDFERSLHGKYEWVSARLFFEPDLLHKDEAILAFRHIHEIRQREMEQRKLLEEALASAQSASEAKNDFLSRMSHDMRTPLNAIIGLSGLAEAHAGNEAEVRGYLAKIGVSSRQLLQLINDVLDMAKLEQGKLELREETFDLVGLVQEIADVFDQQVRQGGKTLALHFEVQNRAVEGDVLRITQILNNLLSNAVKFTPEGGKIEVEVIQGASQYRDQALYRMIVRDNGIGMNADFLSRLFIPFSQEGRYRSSLQGGTGLGMPIVKNIVQIMNGEIEVESEPGKGSVFTVTIPMRIRSVPCGTAAAEQPAGETRLAGKRVLLAEDNEINMEIAAEILGMHGLLVEQAWNGREAVDAFAASEPGHFDFILMDMQMPVLDGCGAARQIRAMQRPDAGNIPIIAVTANAFSDDIARSMDAGMNAHLSKPLDFDKLIQVMEELLSGAS